MFGDFQGAFSTDMNGTTSMAGAAETGSSCWSAAWYNEAPNRAAQLDSTHGSEKPPAHIMIWEERAMRSASQVLAVEAARGRGFGSDAAGNGSGDAADSEGELVSREELFSEDSIFEMDI